MPSGNLIAGNVYHKGLAWLYSRAMQGIDVSEEERRDVANSFWDAEISSQLLRDRESGIAVDIEKIVWGERKPDDVKKRVLAMLDIYAQNFMPLYNPVAVEQKYTKRLSNGVTLIGYIDVEATRRASWASSLKIQGDPAKFDGTRVIIDHKWRDRTAASTALENDFQSTTYTMLTGIPNVEFHEATSRSNLKITPRIIYRSQEDCEWCETMYIEVWELIQHGTFPPNPQNFLCKPDYCPYYSVCRLGW